MLQRLLKEPPFRIATRLAVKLLPVRASVKSGWDVVGKPQYLTGLVHAAREAQTQGITSFCAIEFGVAGGFGLIELQKYAEMVEQEFGVTINVVGFDTGAGLPTFCGDYRDHPDLWVEGDYPMDVDALQSRLSDRTELVLGNVADTLLDYTKNRQRHPVGFVSFDMDLYSSTTDALQLFLFPQRSNLKRVTLYFDDVHTPIYHRRAGEYLAIREFNDKQSSIFIDRWYNVSIDRPFPEAFWLNKMYIAHDLDQISATKMDRPVVVWKI